MAGGATKAGRVLLISVIGVIALAIAAFVIVLSINPPFQATEPTSSATATATPTRTATPTPSATPTTTPTATPTPEPTPSVIPTGDPVPTDDGFRATVTPILNDASTGLDIISESIAAGSLADTKDVVTQLSNDVQRLTDNTKPSDPDTWNGAVQTYAGGLRVLADAIARGDAAAGATAVENSRRDLASLTTLAAQ